VLYVLDELDARSFIEQRFEHALAVYQRCASQVEAIEVQQIEA
jgi:hypothetical protein